MREILFRGYNNISEHRWVYGSYFKYPSGSCFIDHDINNEYLTPVKVVEESVGQYTGFKDKKGTKIFEGDIVKYDNDTYDTKELKFKVIWDKCSCNNGWNIVETKDMDLGWWLSDYIASFCTVIGNIYEDTK